MPQDVEDAGSPEEAVARIEERLGCTLPQEYRSFVLKGSPWSRKQRYVRRRPGEHWPSVAEIGSVYKYKRPVPTAVTIEFMMDIFENREEGDGLIPRDSIAVASCEDDEKILLFVRGERRGQVWIKDWTRLDETGVDDPEVGLDCLAKNFDEFLDKLSESPNP